MPGTLRVDQLDLIAAVRLDNTAHGVELSKGRHRSKGCCAQITHSDRPGWPGFSLPAPMFPVLE